MAKKSLDPLTEPMFYILLCFHRGEMCGVDITNYIDRLTDGRVRPGPGTLYTILSLFQQEKVIEKVSSEGRRITYRITDKGEEIYRNEVARLRKCLEDTEKNPDRIIGIP